MSRMTAKVSEELDHLRRLRDELRVQLHLARAEAKQEWDRLETRFLEAESQLRHRGEDRLEDIGESMKELLHDLRDSYDALRKDRHQPH